MLPLMFAGGSVGGSLPLDNLSAEVAYSMRLLRTAYSGNCLRLRRSTDNAESDFGFVNGVVDTAGIATWLGAATGTLRAWYDQSGNGRDLVQATNAFQPRYQANVQNGIPCVRILLVTSLLSTAESLVIAQPVNIYTAYKITSVGGLGCVYGDGSYGVSGNLFYVVDSGDGTFNLEAPTRLSGGVLSAGVFMVDNHLFNGANSKMRQSGVTVATGNAGANSLNGALNMGTYQTLYMGELIGFSSDQSTNTILEDDLISFWL